MLLTLSRQQRHSTGILVFLNKVYTDLSQKLRQIERLANSFRDVDVFTWSPKLASTFPNTTAAYRVHFFPFAVDADIVAVDEPLPTFDARPTDVFFSGDTNPDKYDFRKQIVDRLKQWKNDGDDNAPKVKLLVHPGPSLTRNAYLKTMAASRIIFSTPLRDVGIVGTRYYEAMARGTLLLCQRSKWYEQLGIVEDEHAVMFGDLEEFVRKVKYWTDPSNFAAALTIIRAARKLVLANHTWRARADAIVHVLEKGSSNIESDSDATQITSSGTQVQMESMTMITLEDHVNETSTTVLPKCRIAAPRGDLLGSRLLAQISCMFVAFYDKSVEYIHMDSICAPNKVCIQTTIGLAFGEKPGDAEMDNFFNFSFGYRNLKNEPQLALVYSRGRSGYSGKSKAQWDAMSADRRNDSTEAFDRSRCPEDSNAVVMAMDGLGCTGEMKAILSNANHSRINSFRKFLRQRFHPQLVSPPGTSFNRTCINVVVHIRQGDQAKWRSMPLNFYSDAMTQLERVFEGEATATQWGLAVQALVQRKTCRKRTYWIHTDGGVKSLSSRLQGDVKWGASLFHVVGKSISVLDAMAHMWASDVLIPSFSSVSVSMGIASPIGLVLYQKNLTMDGTVMTLRCQSKGFCSTLYYPVANDLISNWTNGLGNWFAI